MKLQEITVAEYNELDLREETYFCNGCVFDTADNLIAFCWYASATEEASKYYKVVEE